MRPSRRILLTHSAIFVLLVAVLSGATLAQSSGAPSHPVPQAQLPAKWNDAVRELAEKITNAAGSSHRISLEVNNISSLDSSVASRICQAVESELVGRGFLRGEGGLRVLLTLSEGMRGYIWIAESEAADGRQVAIVTAPKERVSALDQTKLSLSLEKRLVWEQPGRMLDFAVLFDPLGQYSKLLVLEPGQLVYYQWSDGRWQNWRSIPISHQSPWPRSLRGLISASSDVESSGSSDVLCSGDLDDPDKVECGPFRKHYLHTRVNLKIPGHGQGEILGYWTHCGTDVVVLASGRGDWTQPDTLQGFLLADLEAEAAPSGGALEFDGAVTELSPQDKQSAGRVVVRNLKTGKYEAYLVTATCSQ
jgi:hypothetical protein